MIVVGGVVPPQDYDALRSAGAEAIFPPGTVIAEAAEGCSKAQPAARPQDGRGGINFRDCPDAVRIGGPLLRFRLLQARCWSG